MWCNAFARLPVAWGSATGLSLEPNWLFTFLCYAHNSHFVMYDWIKGRSIYLSVYNKFELFILKTPVLIAAISLLLINWIWNINKGL